jgi:hypothetical protein
MTEAEWLSLQQQLAELFTPLVSLWVIGYLAALILIAVVLVFFISIGDRLDPSNL